MDIIVFLTCDGDISEKSALNSFFEKIHKIPGITQPVPMQTIFRRAADATEITEEKSWGDALAELQLSVETPLEGWRAIIAADIEAKRKPLANVVGKKYVARTLPLLEKQVRF